jgi:glucan phosphoethanolaminetransferase (alkaline phosphatase superfamily)
MNNSIKYISFFTFLIFSNLVFFERVTEMISLGKLKNLVLFLGIWFVCIIGMLVALQLKNFKIRLIFGTIFVINTILGMTYFSVGKHYLSYQDIELLWISRANAIDAIGFYLPEVLVPFIISLFGLLAYIIPANNKLQIKKSWISVLSILPIFLLMGVTFVKKGYGTEGMPHQYSPLATFSLYNTYEAFLPGLIGKRHSVSIKPKKEDGTQNIIYIVDESIRADYLDLNNNKGITPYLLEQSSRISNFGSMSSGNNCSGYSNIILRTGTSQKTLGEIGEKPMIWEYAQKAGYKTHYFDAQQTDGILQNFMTKNELKQIDNFQQLDSQNKLNADHIFAQKIRKVLETPGKNFIYINKRGAHFPYIETYPKAEEIYRPSMQLGDELGKDRNKLINSYKNSVTWTVDVFFKLLLGDRKFENNIVFYTSDHGQNLMDNGIMTHCNTQEPHAYEGYVPFFILTDNQNYKVRYDDLAKKQYNKLTHFHIFGSLVSAMGYSIEDVKAHNELSLDGPIIDDRAFTLGSLIPRFGEDVKWFGINSLNLND